MFPANCCGSIGSSVSIASPISALMSSSWKIESKDANEYRTLTVASLSLAEHIPKFESGQINLQTFAESIISGLLHLEFTGSGKHWSWDGCSADNHRKEGDFVVPCELKKDN